MMQVREDVFRAAGVQVSEDMSGGVAGSDQVKSSQVHSCHVMSCQRREGGREAGRQGRGSNYACLCKRRPSCMVGNYESL